MKVLDIKGIIFDYGGTLDTRGDHWSEVLWQGYEHFGIGVADDEEVEPGVSIHKQAFRDAYVYGERALAVNCILQYLIDVAVEIGNQHHRITILLQMLQHLLVFIQKSKGLGIDIASHIHSNLLDF